MGCTTTTLQIIMATAGFAASAALPAPLPRNDPGAEAGPRKPSFDQLMKQQNPDSGRHARSGCVSSWIGDGYCDKGNNHADCGDFDGGDCCPHTCRDAGYSCGYAGYICKTPPTAHPSRGALEDVLHHNTDCLSPGVEALRARALSNMVDYAALQASKAKPDQHWFCSNIGEYSENDPSTYTIAGREITIMQPCNTESGLAMDAPLVCNRPAGTDSAYEKVSAAFAFGTAFFHASGACVKDKDSQGARYDDGQDRSKAPYLADLIPMKMFFAKLLQMLDPNPRFNRVHGRSDEEKRKAETYADSIRNIDAKIDEFWNIVTNRPVETWDNELYQLHEQIPGMETSLVAIGTRVGQTCDSVERLLLKVGFNVAADSAFLAKGYNPDTWRMPVDTALCDAFMGLVPSAIEAFTFQEAVFPPELMTAMSALGMPLNSPNSGQQWSQYWCPTSDHSRYHLLGAELGRNIAAHIGKMNARAGAKTDVALWHDGTHCAEDSTCRYCRNPSTVWVGLAFTACGVEPKYPAGKMCVPGISCEAMCEPGLGFSWWVGPGGFRCGHEPCWSEVRCLAGTTCESNCCGSYRWDWGRFGHFCW